MTNERFPRADNAAAITVRGDLWNRLVDRIERLERLTVAAPLMLDDNGSGRVLRVKATPPTPPRYGKVATVWDGASNEITLTPVKSATDATVLTDASGDPLPDVTVKIKIPLGTNAGALPVPVDGILAYDTFGTGDDQYRILHTPPEVPAGGSRYMGLTRMDDVGTVGWDYERGHV